MALTYRFYRAPVIGDGSLHNGFRNALDNYIHVNAGETHWDWDNPARAVRYALCLADSATHATIDEDATITALSAELPDVAAVNAWLDNRAPDLSIAIQNLLEGDGISVAWLVSQTSVRQLFAYASKIHVLAQNVKGLRNDNAMQLFKSALTLQVNQLTAAQRNAVATWMTNKGLDTSWITGTTRVRQVVQYVIENLTLPTMALGPADLG